MRPFELVKMILEETGGDIPAAIDALEDGEALLSMGVTDQSLVEDAHYILRTRLNLCRRHVAERRQLIDAIQALGLSEKDTASLLGVPVHTWRKWRKLEREPSSASLQTMRLLLMLDALAPALLAGVREWQ